MDRIKNEELALVRSPIFLMESILGLEQRSPEDINLDYVIDLEKRVVAKYKELSTKQVLSDGVFHLLRTLSEQDPQRMLKDELDAQYMSRFLTVNGYKVQKIPGYGVFEKNHLPSFFMGTNVILSGDKAIIPKNGISELDRVNEQIYQKMGYRVFKMHSHEKTICLFGGIRCASETFRLPIPAGVKR